MKVTDITYFLKHLSTVFRYLDCLYPTTKKALSIII